MKVVFDAKVPVKFEDLEKGDCFYYVKNGKPLYFMKIETCGCMETNAISLQGFSCAHFYDSTSICYCDSTLTIYKEEC